MANPWDVKKSDRCAHPHCDWLATTKIATARDGTYVYVPACNTHVKKYLARDPLTVETIERF